jgi:hypothetical protein
MPEDYQDLVLAAYERKRDSGELYSILPRETTARIKRACLKVYDSRYDERDADILSMFFDVDKMGCDFREIINKSETDDFKTLWKYIRKDTDRTSEENSELLAWLIDFQPRPSIAYYKSINEGAKSEDGEIINNPVITKSQQVADETASIVEDETKIEALKEEEKKNNNKASTIAEIITVPKDNEEKGVSIDTGAKVGEIKSLISNQTDKPEEPQDTKEEIILPKKRFRMSISFRITISFIILFIVGLAYGFWKKNKDKTIRQPLSTEHCMYWTGQHYEPINCDNNDLDKLKIPLNQEQLEHQQRITMPDTLTNHALGRVWYGKVNGSTDKTPQFYADSGTNPLDTTRRLLPVTTYMLNKYVSYERHLLNTLVWTVSLVVLFSLLITLAYKTRPRGSSAK